MITRNRTAIALLALVATTVSPALADDRKAALPLVQKMLNQIDNSTSMYLHAIARTTVQQQPAAGSTMDMLAEWQKPNLSRIVAKSTAGNATMPTMTMVADGKTIWQVGADGAVRSVAAAPGAGAARMVTRLIRSLLTGNGSRDFGADETVTLRAGKWNHQICRIVDVSLAGANSPQVDLYLGTDGLPKRLVVARTSPPITIDISVSSLRLNAALPASDFVFHLPPGAHYPGQNFDAQSKALLQAADAAMAANQALTATVTCTTNMTQNSGQASTVVRTQADVALMRPNYALVEDYQLIPNTTGAAPTRKHVGTQASDGSTTWDVDQQDHYGAAKTAADGSNLPLSNSIYFFGYFNQSERIYTTLEADYA
ncbi:MAG: LolA family protein, partial [Capsulimonadaceae bacterium]